eukprot:2079981-Prymnesium_polylepis.1
MHKAAGSGRAAARVAAKGVQRGVQRCRGSRASPTHPRRLAIARRRGCTCRSGRATRAPMAATA